MSCLNGILALWVVSKARANMFCLHMAPSIEINQRTFHENVIGDQPTARLCTYLQFAILLDGLAAAINV